MQSWFTLKKKRNIGSQRPACRQAGAESLRLRWTSINHYAEFYSKLKVIKKILL